MNNLFSILLIVFSISVNNLAADQLLDVAEDELFRNFKNLKEQDTKPYFISYNITDLETFTISSSFGHTIKNSDNNSRILDIDLRVGDYSFDNTHIIRGSSFSFGSAGGTVYLPLEDNQVALRNSMWFATDREYKSAIERFEKAKTNAKVKVEQEDKSDDFSREKPNTYSEESRKINFDRYAWEKKLNSLSSLFNSYEKLYDGNVFLQVENKTKYYVNTEGSKLKWDESFVRLFVIAKTKADDGMSLPLYKSYFAFDMEGLPTINQVENDIKEMISLLKKLREAPLMDTFSGPAILSGESSGVFFHEIFGHRVEGHREKDPSSSQTFKKMIGEEVLPNFIDVIFDPTRKERAGKQLSGFYKYDDQGVEAQKVISVKDGEFLNFLMCRCPIEGFPQSNGHGRKQAGYDAVARQSNLIVQSDNSLDYEELKEQLIDLCNEQEKEFGLLFEKVQGGFTFTGRTVPNAFNVQPLVVYKIYADGRPDELVRGVDLIGTPLATFSNIVSTSDDIGIFNGICGAESGGVPVSASSPDILVKKIEVQKKKKSQARPPLLNSPDKIKGVN